MSSPTFFTVEADFRAVIEDAASDSDYNPEISPISATVTFTPVLASGDVILATGTSPRPIGYVPATITAIIDPADGRLKLRTATDAGATGFSFAPVRLLADTPLLELASPLYYRVEFTNVQFGSPARLGRITGFTFQAPNADQTINLIGVGRAPSAVSATGINRIAPTSVRFENDTMIFQFAGVDIPSALPLSAITGPTGATGVAATVSVGSVDTGEPGSSVTVTNSGSSGAAVFDFVIPRGDIGATGASGASGGTGGTGAEGASGVPGATGLQGVQGVAGVSVDIQGAKSSWAEIVGLSSPANGDAWVDSSSGLLYFYDGVSWPAEGAGVPFQGPIGPQGNVGSAATISVGSTSTGTAGSEASVANSGSSSAAVFDFTIPRGDTGATGSEGPQGEVGPTGATGPEGPQGGTGPQGEVGATGPQGPAGQAANLLGTVATYAALLDVEDPADGDAYLIADGAGKIYIYDTVTGWPGDGDGIQFVGPVGASGASGPVGASGEPGASGVPGEQGASGVPGASGPAGASGETGATGPAGASGEPGPTGATGATGASGGTGGTGGPGTTTWADILDKPGAILNYKGTWNASTNDPELSDATGSGGDVYRVSVGGSRNLGSGSISWDVGDYAIWSPVTSSWEKADTTDAVSSVAGRTGDVTLTSTDVGLGNVDNTSDATKNSATATLTNKTLDSPAVTGTAKVAQGGAVEVYNTSDQTTNMERLVARYSSNVAELGHIFSGTGSARTLRVGVGNTAGSGVTRFVEFQTGVPFINMATSTGTNGNLFAVMSGQQLTSSSGVQNCLAVVPTANQSSTGGYVGLLVNVTETATGSGTKRLIDAQVGGATQFSVGNAGAVFVAGTLDLGHASDTTLSRSAAGRLAVEGKDALLTDSTDTVTNKTISGASNTITNLGVAAIGASGTASSSTFLRGDGQWAAPSGITRVVQTITEPTTLGASGNTDYMTFCSAVAGSTSVVALIKGEGANNSTTITDSAGIGNWTANGDAKITTGQFKYGSGSIIFDGSGDSLTPTAAASNYTFGTGDFTIEMWVRPTTISGANRVLLDGRPTNTNGAYPTLFITNTGELNYYANSAVRINGGTLSTNTWYHIAVSRSGTSTRMFLDGTQVGSTYTDSTNYTVGTNRPILASNGFGNDSLFIGQLDEIRITKGYAFYTSNFTAPTSELFGPIIGTPTLPGASGNTNRYSFRNISSASVIVGASGAEAINGATGGLTLGATGSAELVSNGTGWYTL